MLTTAFSYQYATDEIACLTAATALALLVPIFVTRRSFSRNTLRKTMESWTDRVVEYQDIRLKRAAWELRTMVYRVAIGYTRWLVRSSDATQRKSLHSALSDSSLVCEFLREDNVFTANHPLLEWLHDGPRIFPEKAKALREWADVRLRRRARAPRSLNLPDLPGDNMVETLQGWILSKEWQPKKAVQEMEDWLAWWRDLVAQASSHAAPWLLRSENGDWTGCMENPLVPVDERDSAAQPLAGLMQFANFLTTHAPWKISLEALMLDQIVHADTRLLRDEARTAITGRCLPPSPGGHSARLRVISAPDGPLSRGLGLPNEACYEVEDLPFGAVVSVQANVAVETIQESFDARKAKNA